MISDVGTNEWRHHWRPWEIIVDKESSNNKWGLLDNCVNNWYNNILSVKFWDLHFSTITGYFCRELNNYLPISLLEFPFLSTTITTNKTSPTSPLYLLFHAHVGTSVGVDGVVGALATPALGRAICLMSQWQGDTIFTIDLVAVTTIYVDINALAERQKGTDTNIKWPFITWQLHQRWYIW